MLEIVGRGESVFAKLTLVNGSKCVKPSIAWRNPDPVRGRRRRHTTEGSGERRVYVLQEFVEDGGAGHWSRISDLEVVAGGRAA